MTSAKPLHEPRNPAREARTATNRIALAGVLLLAVVGILLSTFGFAPALVFTGLAFGLGFWSHHSGSHAAPA